MATFSKYLIVSWYILLLVPRFTCQSPGTRTEGDTPWSFWSASLNSDDGLERLDQLVALYYATWEPNLLKGVIGTWELNIVEFSGRVVLVHRICVLMAVSSECGFRPDTSYLKGQGNFSLVKGTSMRNLYKFSVGTFQRAPRQRPGATEAIASIASVKHQTCGFQSWLVLKSLSKSLYHNCFLSTQE